jgi:hypothetical protein
MGVIAMTSSARKMLLWSPRILGILVALFLAVFALDAFAEGKGLVEALPDLLIHVAPALVLLLVVAVSWRREWVGGVVFTAVAVAYSVTTLHRLDWILVIAGPLLLVGSLFLLSWRHHKELHARG